MHIHLMTRGLGRDYGFLGSPPPESWWRQFAQLTAFEQPTLLVHGDDAGWRLYASAIPTARRDRTNTVIRISLILAGQHDQPDEAAAAIPLIRDWLAGDAVGGSAVLSGLLDARLPAKDVEPQLATSGPHNDDAIRKHVTSALAELPHASLAAEVSRVPDSWVGDVGSAAARRAFAQRAEALVRGHSRGWAVQLNLAGAAELRELADRGGAAWVGLVDERIPKGISDLCPKAQPLRRRRSMSIGLRIAAVTLAIGAAIALAWVLAYRQSAGLK